jgi:flagellin
MPTVINTNLASLFAQNSLSNAQNNLAQSVQRLSSGLRINSAKDDAAGLSISQNMQSQINGTNQSIRNLSDATNLLQVADSSLSTVQDMLLRLKQLATQGYDGSLSTSQKLNIVQEMKDLNNEINATAARTAFNGIKLLSSGSSVDLNNSDIKAGTALTTTTPSVTLSSTSFGIGYYANGGSASPVGLADAASGLLLGVGNTGTTATTYNVVLDPAMAPKIAGSYTFSSNGSALTITGTLNGLAASQTVNVADALSNATGGTFSNFGIKLDLTSVRAAGDTLTGTAIATKLATSAYRNLQINGVNGEITDVRLSGVAPGTYSLTYNETGTIGAATNLSLPATVASGETAQVAYGTVSFTGGSGSSATGTLVMDSSGNYTGYTVVNAGSGYKAGDVLGVAARAEVTTVQFTSTLAAGGSVTIGGRTVTAAGGGTASANDVAAAFRTGATAGLTNVASITDSGTFAFTMTGSTDTAIFTANTAGRLANLTATTTGGGVTSTINETTKGMNAVTGIVVGKDIGGTLGGTQTLTMSGTINGLATTQSLAVSANAALATQTFNFTSFGAQFDVKSYQGQTATQIGTAIATLNGLGGTASFGNPGQLIVAQGNNSALKFQSGANSDAFIQVDTLNVQTASSGAYAGTASEMMTLGTRISQSGTGNLGTLGSLDTIDTWQTAFKNAAAAVDSALEYVSTQRSVYGSQMNRLSYVSTNLQAQSTNIQNSRSAIIDTDFAAETARLTKGQIMQQAATAMLAQANQMPNVILSLLK